MVLTAYPEFLADRVPYLTLPLTIVVLLPRGVVEDGVFLYFCNELDLLHVQ